MLLVTKFLVLDVYMNKNEKCKLCINCLFKIGTRNEMRTKTCLLNVSVISEGILNIYSMVYMK